MKVITNTVNEFYLKLHSIQNLFEVMLQSMSYCQENNIVTNNNIELAELIQKKVYELMEEIDTFMTSTQYKG